MNRFLSDAALWLLRLRSQRLLLGEGVPHMPPQPILEEVAGVQAQDLSAALLAVRVRSTGLTAAAIEAARQDGSILQAWCMRGTLHLVSREDAAWLIPFFGPGLIAGDRRRFTALGWDDDRADRGLGLLEAALAEHSSLTRAEIIHLLEQAGLPSTGQAPVHLIYRAALEGRLCIGTERGRQTAYLPFEKWVGPVHPLPREAALAELARRYLAAFGPAAPADLASWAGLKSAEARAAWSLIAAELTALETAHGPLWLLTSRLPWLDEPPPASPLVRLLPWFDNLLLGYASRDWLCPPIYAKRINAGGGLIHPTLLVDGAVLGTWKLVRRRSALEVHLDPFAPLPASLSPALENEVAALARFLNHPAALA